jgi:hypothetical protein
LLKDNPAVKEKCDVSHSYIANHEALKFEFEKQNQILLEVSTHLHNCLHALQSSDESVIHCDSLVIQNSVHADNLRQMMRKVEDDVISQMALLAGLKNTMTESVDDGHTEVYSQIT